MLTIETLQVVAETAANASENAPETTNNVIEALLMSGAGMIGIFIVIGVIILSVSLLNKLGADKKKD